MYGNHYLPSGYPEAAMGYPEESSASGGGGLLDSLAFGNVGQTAELGPGGNVALIQLTSADWAAQLVTVCIVPPELITSGEFAGASEPMRGAHVIATATWGVGGLRASAEIDCARGTHFSVPAASLVVSVRHSIASPPGPIYRVGAFVGYATRPSSSSPQRTLYGRASETEVLDAAIPAFATALRVMRVAGAIEFSIAFAGMLGERLAEVVVRDIEQPPLVPIPNGAERVQIATTRASDFALVFGLCL